MENRDEAWPTGCVHVYTGNGKGKTTAALGLALRAAGAGLAVFVGQFLKGMTCSENKALERFSDLVTLRQYGRGRFIGRRPDPDDILAARKGLDETKAALASGKYKVVILDEANVATHFEMFPVEDLLDLIEARPEHVELVITGRNADPRVIAAADLVTEMREVKHYYNTGVRARTGIEK